MRDLHVLPVHSSARFCDGNPFLTLLPRHLSDILLFKQKQTWAAAAHAHVEWLKRTLSESTATWIIATGHHHVWSSMHYGPLYVSGNTLQHGILRVV